MLKTFAASTFGTEILKSVKFLLCLTIPVLCLVSVVSENQHGKSRQVKISNENITKRRALKSSDLFFLLLFVFDSCHELPPQISVASKSAAVIRNSNHADRLAKRLPCPNRILPPHEEAMPNPQFRHHFVSSRERHA